MTTINRNDLTKQQSDSMHYHHKNNNNYKIKRNTETVDIYCSCGNDFSVTIKKENNLHNCIKCGKINNI